MKTILYATDCSTHSTTSLRYANKLSDNLKANLVVLHVYAMPPIKVSTIRTPKQLKKLAYEEHLAILREYCSKHLITSGTC